MSSAQQFSASRNAKSEATFAKSVTQIRDRVNATMKNQTPYKMTLLRNKSWSGDPETCFPVEIASNDCATFTHLSDGNFGSRGAVIYAGLTATGRACAWLLAWDAPASLTPQTPNRVYVDCGPKDMFEAIEWMQVDSQLQIAPASNLEDDAITQTMVTAKFDETIPNPATVEAAFGYM